MGGRACAPAWRRERTPSAPAAVCARGSGRPAGWGAGECVGVARRGKASAFNTARTCRPLPWRRSGPPPRRRPAARTVRCRRRRRWSAPPPGALGAMRHRPSPTIRPYGTPVARLGARMAEGGKARGVRTGSGGNRAKILRQFRWSAMRTNGCRWTGSHPHAPWVPYTRDDGSLYQLVPRSQRGCAVCWALPCACLTPCVGRPVSVWASFSQLALITQQQMGSSWVSSSPGRVGRQHKDRRNTLEGLCGSL